MTHGQIDMFVEDKMDEASFEIMRSRCHFEMLTDVYREIESDLDKRVGKRGEEVLRCARNNALVMVLDVPCQTVAEVRRKVLFILQNEPIIKNLDNSHVRILLSSLVCLKRTTGDLNHLYTLRYNRMLEDCAGILELVALPCLEPEDAVAKALFLLCEFAWLFSDFAGNETRVTHELLSSFMHLKEA